MPLTQNLGPVMQCMFGTKTPSTVANYFFLYFFADRPVCAQFPSFKCAHISLWLNPMGHNKFHNTSKPPATDPGRTACTPLYPPVQAVAPPPFFPLFRTEDLAKAGTCARDRRVLQQLALNVHVKHLDLTAYYCTNIAVCCCC